MRLRHWTTLLVVLALLGLGCAATGERRARAAAWARPAPREPREAPFDVEHYALDLRLDPTARSLHGTCRVRLWPRRGLLEWVALDLMGLDVESIHDADGRELGFAHLERGFDELDGTLQIELAEPARPGAPVELTIRYGGVPAKGLWYSGEVQGVPTQAFTQGECQDARWWFPCFDEPHDRATSEVRVELPPGWRSVAAGELIDRGEVSGGGVFEHWRMASPHPTYLVTLVAGDLVRATDAWDGIPLSYMAAAAHAGLIERTFAETPRVLEVFSELTAVRYPFAKYSQACVDNFPLGGMENVSATTLTETVLRDELGRRDYDPIELISHEAAHQWFGNLVTCRDWSHIWLNEGFATYAELLYLERTRGADRFLVGVRDMQDAYVAADVGSNRRPTVWNVYKDPIDLFGGGHSYPGGASRLHLLRGVLGDEAFFAGLRAYLSENAGGSVTTDDLQDALERASGRDLSALFRQWFHQPGYPEFELRWRWDEHAREVVVDVEQVQESADGTPAVFRLPAEIEVQVAAGSRIHRVELVERRERVRLPATERPRWVRFDPTSWIPKRLNESRSVAAWLHIAEDCDDPNARRDALAVLGRLLEQSADEDERDAALAVLVARTERDRSDAVRASAARALGSGGQRRASRARAALLAAAERDSSADVRVASLQALAAWGADPELADFARRTFEQRFSWMTMGAAAELVRSAEPDRHAAYAWVAERLDLESPHDELRASLLRTLAATDLSRAADILHSFALDEAAGQAARVAAVSWLGSVARYDTRIREDLEQLLSTRLYRLRAATVEALGVSTDQRALRALEEAHAGETDPRIRRAIEGILRRERARS